MRVVTRTFVSLLLLVINFLVRLQNTLEGKVPKSIDDATSKVMENDDGK